MLGKMRFIKNTKSRKKPASPCRDGRARNPGQPASWVERQAERRWDAGFETRRGILDVLTEGPATASELAELLKLTTTAIQRQLRQMSDAGAIVVQRVDHRPGPVRVWGLRGR